MTEVIRTTVTELTSELLRRGISSDEPLVVTLEAEDTLFPGRREARARVVAAGFTDEDIDRLIKQAQAEDESFAR